MAAKDFNAVAVAQWSRRVLAPWEGRYRLQDETFSADTVRVFGYRGLTFAITIEAWTDDRGALEGQLVRWASSALQADSSRTAERDNQPPQPPPQKATNLKVFLAHASEDKPLVREVHSRLKRLGFIPWLDEIDLAPGQDWHLEISKAIRESDVVVACFSRTSVAKQSYCQRELRMALTMYAEKPSGSIYLIPLKLDDCTMPDYSIPELGISLRNIQWVEYSKPGDFERMVRGIRTSFGVPQDNTTTSEPYSLEWRDTVSRVNDSRLEYRNWTHVVFMSETIAGSATRVRAFIDLKHGTRVTRTRAEIAGHGWHSHEAAIKRGEQYSVPVFLTLDQRVVLWIDEQTPRLGYTPPKMLEGSYITDSVFFDDPFLRRPLLTGQYSLRVILVMEGGEVDSTWNVFDVD
jgi:hypothetical protein